jgi:hypothetical protein
VCALGAALVIAGVAGCGGSTQTAPTASANDGTTSFVGTSAADALARATLKVFGPATPTDRTDVDVARLGFASLADMRQAEVERPVAVYRVSLDAVSGFGASGAADAALTPTGLRMYPVLSHGAVVSAITVQENEGPARVVSIGRAPLAKSIHDARASVAAAEALPEEDDATFAVELTGLSAWFIGHRDTGGALHLAPIRNDARTPDLAPGRSVLAGRVLAQYQPFAARALEPSR